VKHLRLCLLSACMASAQTPQPALCESYNLSCTPFTQVPPTLQIGSAVYPTTTIDTDYLVKLTNDALYQPKITTSVATSATQPWQIGSAGNYILPSDSITSLTSLNVPQTLQIGSAAVYPTTTSDTDYLVKLMNGVTTSVATSATQTFQIRGASSGLVLTHRQSIKRLSQLRQFTSAVRAFQMLTAA